MRTSSIKIKREERVLSLDVAGRRPNSNFVSARITPFASAWVAASAVWYASWDEMVNMLLHSTGMMTLTYCID